MKKTISGVLLALAATFALVACGKKKTTTAAKDQTTKAKTTEKKTTKEHKRRGQANVINFYCWNSEFQERVNACYPNVKGVDGAKTNLKSGQTIIWSATPNQGSAYQDALDLGLENDMVDMYVFEADFATKYVKSEYAIEMSTFNVDQSKQYKYTKDIVTNGEGKIVGSSWQATPGVIIYNQNVAKAVYGDDVTYEDMDAKLSKDFKTFATTAKEVKEANKDKFTLTGPADWFRAYSNSVKTKMYDGTSITVAKELFQWAKDTKDFVTAGYIHGVEDGYALWGGDWAAQQGQDNDLCIFSVPWFSDFCLTGNRAPQYETEEDKAKGYVAAKDSGLRVVAGYQSWFWGGTWLTATPVSQQETTIKEEVGNIIKEMTTNKEVLLGISSKYADFTNHEAAMDELGADTTYVNGYFGGKNVFEIYAKAVKAADLSGASDFDQQINENIQSAFMLWFQGTKTAEEAWKQFVSDVETKTSKKVAMAEGVTISGNAITIA